LEAIVTKIPALRGIALFAGLLGGVVAASAEGQPPAAPAVIELFTSQGCSSCPKADRLLQTLSERPGVIALSFPVTYWDYLGWKDTLANPENTVRQRGYAAAQGEGQVYTPEAVVNGLKSCVGSDLNAIEDALKATAPVIQREAVPLTAKREGSQFRIEAGAAPGGSQVRSGKIWIAAVRQKAPVTIARGENAGRVVTYINVVRNLVAAGEWQGAPTSYAVPVAPLAKDGDMFVVFLQAERLGPILAALVVTG
jgi:hypothetical protein